MVRLQTVALPVESAGNDVKNRPAKVALCVNMWSAGLWWDSLSAVDLV